MDIIECFGAIIVSLVIKMFWTLNRTMESIEELHNESHDNSRHQDDSVYYTASIQEDYHHPEVVNENKDNSNQQRSQPPAVTADVENVRKSVVTSTPQAKNVAALDIISPGYSDIEEFPKETIGGKHSTPRRAQYEQELVNRICMLKIPTEEDAEAIRTTFARGKISSETELKHKQFLESPLTKCKPRGPKASQRKHIRL